MPAVQTLDELLESVDAVSLAVAPQAPLAHDVLTRGVCLLLEKPVSTDVAVVRDLAAEVGSQARAGCVPYTVVRAAATGMASRCARPRLRSC